MCLSIISIALGIVSLSLILFPGVVFRKNLVIQWAIQRMVWYISSTLLDNYSSSDILISMLLYVCEPISMLVRQALIYLKDCCIYRRVYSLMGSSLLNGCTTLLDNYSLMGQKDA